LHTKSPLFHSFLIIFERIRYINLNGEQLYYDHKRILKEFFRTRFKNSTSTTQFYHPKGVDTTEIDYFGKLIMCSNNENNFIQLEKSDIRFFVVKVKPFEKEDPDFFEKLVKEIPFFLHF